MEEKKPQTDEEKDQKFLQNFFSQLYIPGHMKWDPHKAFGQTICYHLFYVQGKAFRWTGFDSFETFLGRADAQINHNEGLRNKIVSVNPYNISASFNLNQWNPDTLQLIQKRAQQKYGIKTDADLIAIEGCEEDDHILLGGKDQFLEHFCTFFKFNICNDALDRTYVKYQSRYEDPDYAAKKLEKWIRDLDQKYI